jgi:hypothetical protein
MDFGSLLVLVDNSDTDTEFEFFITNQGGCQIRYPDSQTQELPKKSSMR